MVIETMPPAAGEGQIMILRITIACEEPGLANIAFAA